jgi:hypothetical protein
LRAWGETLIAAFTLPLPLAVILELLGVPATARAISPIFSSKEADF